MKVYYVTQLLKHGSYNKTKCHKYILEFGHASKYYLNIEITTVKLN